MRIKKTKKKTKKQKVLDKLIPGLFLVVIGTGVVFAAYQPYKNHLVKNTGEKVVSIKQTAKTVKSNQGKTQSKTEDKQDEQAAKESPSVSTETSPNYDPSQVTELTMADVLEGNRNAERIVRDFGVGKIVLPNLGIKLPILVGIANTNLAVGAGTMKNGQQMGVGNYALAGHHMNNKNLLFGPLEDAAKDQLIFVTDYEKIYEYKITSNKIVGPNDGYVINDVADKNLITLITCAEGGKTRYAVQGELSKVYTDNDVPSEIKQLFN
ncbi:hypothetical protein CKN63_13415 [Carnobacterium divergens]|uniref:class A sortase n=1 Tax=Carnobacterium divergens TaxID=2748 RepID=UPI0010729883|nr:class A sortase [Carnobacterium divergens]TFI60557.1 hypothetical protein CKN59_13350 [Carnobacterium divergens]TFI61644.1 hypothetical protein CKN76_12635 [Carnobacterium divergens]TFJ01032.1 hypothetical protein CKN75_12940 [Carnobacterium divergens]TFJ15661.1 hypothetical protein CKN63_13415 [Carnobacterium divergens]